jgi:murein DD-endopeptidase MepM/ murein hydrolase activator NlpD
VADGTVVAVQDGLPDETPGQPPQNVKQPSNFGGNSVSIEIAPGDYAFYAHFQPGTVTVSVGDRVTTGQVLGLLGNSGNSGAPHLHFGLNDDPDPIVANSLPMVFDRWTLSGTVPLEPFLDPSWPTLQVESTPSEQTGTHQLFLDVADFG